MSPSIRHLYLHIPFCPAKCPYCAFVTHVGSLRRVQPYVAALEKEIGDLARLGRSSPMETVYLGGGTPSMLSPAQVGSILAAVRRSHGIAEGAEISLEAHPSTVDREKLEGFLAAGVTRISFGGESLQPDELAALGRDHAPGRVLQVVELARAVGFESINVDLMYGLPDQSLASWQQTVRQLLEIRPDHVSLYPLQVEPRTVFGRRHREGSLVVADDELVAGMYETAVRAMRAGGYEHYEMANWALHGHRSRHNLAYWMDREYLAAGVGAHGYLHPFRTENTRQLGRYIDRLEAGQSPVDEREYVDPSAHLAERVFLGLRLLSDGLDLTALERDFGPDARALVEDVARRRPASSHLRLEGDRLHLQEQSVPIANEVLDAFVSLDPDPAAALA